MTRRQKRREKWAVLLDKTASINDKKRKSEFAKHYRRINRQIEMKKSKKGL